ncbi:hypothetical protein KKH00_03525 [Patescibacteria group bacterium]|nr:hypothetical protein [Patescibacteria group bacterium]
MDKICYQGFTENPELMKLIKEVDQLTEFGEVRIILFKHQGKLMSAVVEPIIKYKVSNS